MVCAARWEVIEPLGVRPSFTAAPQAVIMDESSLRGLSENLSAKRLVDVGRPLYVKRSVVSAARVEGEGEVAIVQKRLSARCVLN